jgi:para-nitrobenzyl esterase
MDVHARARRAGLILAAGLMLGAFVVWAQDDDQGSRDALIVRTESGFVRGVLEGHQRSFKGIPFAAPPIGRLRWRPPEPAIPWSGIRDATSFGPDCIQDTGPGVAGQVVPEGSEDCLALNVFIPDSADADSRLPVMVYLFPGGNLAERGYERAGQTGSHPGQS